MSEIDSLLQTVMFTIYGNQYESREEHLLLTMFQVCTLARTSPTSPPLSAARHVLTLYSRFSRTSSTTLPNTRPSSERTRLSPA
jgi:hypothetical protein